MQKQLNIGQSKTEFPLSNGNTVLLDPSDMNIMQRFKEVQKDFSGFEESALELKAEKKDDEKILDALNTLHTRMCEKIDYLFDSPVSAPCCGNANMFDVKNGKFRFEGIIEGLLCAYEDNIGAEIKKMQARLSKAKNKYNV